MTASSPNAWRTWSAAAAIAAAALYVRDRYGDDAVIHVLASDHAVEADDNYWWSIDTAAAAARSGRLVTFGITPTAPEIGYGYIEAGAELGNGVRAVARFVEKPDRPTAEKMLAVGGYYWNSGTFMLGVSSFLSEVEALAPETFQTASQAPRSDHGKVTGTRATCFDFSKMA